MSTKAVKAALEARLVAIASPLPTQWENVAFTKPTDGEGNITPWQRADMLPAQPANPTMGDGYYREVGLFVVTLSYPINGGSGPAYAKALAVQKWFKRGLSLSADGITTMIQRTPSVGPGRTVDDRFVIPISIRYFANIFN